jgi:hypothetical protein
VHEFIIRFARFYELVVMSWFMPDISSRFDGWEEEISELPGNGSELSLFGFAIVISWQIGSSF